MDKTKDKTLFILGYIFLNLHLSISETETLPSIKGPYHHCHHRAIVVELPLPDQVAWKKVSETMLKQDFNKYCVISALAAQRKTLETKHKPQQL